ncbi:hypothetical protein FRB96_006245 [Tulasnella sp. 330]|nr:hypothetical protein FRB96_006245 [Tulasnella sp. 330]
MPSDIQVPPPLHQDREMDYPSELDPLLAIGLKRGKTHRPGDLIGAVIALISVVALAVFTWTLTITNNPKSLSYFAYHPPLQTLAIVFFTAGILALQATSFDNQEGRRKGLVQHQIWQAHLGFPVIALGGIVMQVGFSNIQKWLTADDPSSGE